MKIARYFEVILVLLLIGIFTPILLLVGISVRLTSMGPIIYWSQRIGEGNRQFLMPKFRTMQIDAPVVATHLLNDPEKHLTPIGSFLRRSSLDELPQLWCILVGTMTFVGPRPALFNQEDLIEKRTLLGIHMLRPGITGWAQVNGRDDLSIDAKVALDKYFLEKNSFFLNVKIIWLTALKVLSSKNVSH